VSGLWQARVAVTPVAGISTPLRVAAQTHNNLSIQPLRVDVAPDAPLVGGLYAPGGVRIVLRMSGLTPGASQFPSLATAYKDARGDGGPTSGSQSSLSADGGPGVLPNFVIALDVQGRPEDTPGTVGADSAVELELIYLHPPQPPLMLRFDTITLSTGDTIQGPWVFSLTGG
jgi:hypothetical protein